MRLFRKDKKDAQERVVIALMGAEAGQGTAAQILDAPAMELLFHDASKLAAVVPYALARLMGLLADHEREKIRREVVRTLELVAVPCPALVNGTLWRMTHDKSKRVRQEAEAALVSAQAAQDDAMRRREAELREAMEAFAAGA